jgi:hypothetical protein
VLALALGVPAAGCGAGADSPPPGTGPPAAPAAAARADLAARAAAAQDLVAVSFYTLEAPRRDDRTVMVVRAADGSWRVDIPGAALGGAVDIAVVGNDAGLFHCLLAEPPQQGACVAVADLTEEVDPRVQRVFSDWLQVLTDRAAAISVVSARLPTGSPAATGPGSTGPGSTGPDAAGPDTACFDVASSAASLLAPLDPGVYCFAEDGTLTRADLQWGRLTLVSTGAEAPPTAALPGPVVEGDPLPLASPTPTPTPSPTAAPAQGG